MNQNKKISAAHILPKQKRLGEGKHIVIHAIFLLVCICCVLPVILLISTALTSQEDLVANGVTVFPKKVCWDAFRLTFKNPSMILNAYKVSILVTGIGTVLNVLICSLAAYPLSKPNYKYAQITSFFLYFTMLFSGGMVPFYILVVQILHLKDSIWSLILPVLASPWIIFLLRTFFRSVPVSLYESAKLDGAGEYRMFFHILVPLSKPAIATAALMIALNYWNDWYHGMLFIEDQSKVPLQLMLQQLTDYIDMLKVNQSRGLIVNLGEIPSDGIVAATSIIAIGPMLFVFMLFQKYFISGITTGAVKE